MIFWRLDVLIQKITLNFEQVDIHEIFQDTLQTLRVLIDRKRMDVVMNIDEALPSIYC